MKTEILAFVAFDTQIESIFLEIASDGRICEISNPIKTQNINSNL